MRKQSARKRFPKYCCFFTETYAFFPDGLMRKQSVSFFSRWIDAPGNDFQNIVVCLLKSMFFSKWIDAENRKSRHGLVCAFKPGGLAYKTQAKNKKKTKKKQKNVNIERESADHRR